MAKDLARVLVLESLPLGRYCSIFRMKVKNIAFSALCSSASSSSNVVSTPVCLAFKAPTATVRKQCDRVERRNPA